MNRYTEAIIVPSHSVIKVDNIKIFTLFSCDDQVDRNGVTPCSDAPAMIDQGEHQSYFDNQARNVSSLSISKV